MSVVFSPDKSRFKLSFWYPLNLIEQLNFFSITSTVSVGQFASSESFRLSPPIVISTCCDVSGAPVLEAVLDVFAADVLVLDAVFAAEPDFFESVFV